MKILKNRCSEIECWGILECLLAIYIRCIFFGLTSHILASYIAK